MDSFGVDVHTQYIMPHMHTTHKCKYHNVHVHTDTHTYRYIPVYANIHSTMCMYTDTYTYTNIYILYKYTHH